jgi:hypothetical protein
MAGQAYFGQINETEFSSLLQALSSTSKGRAFLDEYRRRFQPEDTLSLLESLRRIETTMVAVRDQLQPERIADELRHIAMSLDIAIDGAEADPEGDETARRFALAGRARQELETLASHLAGGSPELSVVHAEDEAEAAAEIEAVDDAQPGDEPAEDDESRGGLLYRLRDPGDDR